MANVAATIARDGVWVRPRLVADAAAARPVHDRQGNVIPDRVDLRLSREGLAAAKEGMLKVVNSPAGTGKDLVAGDDVLKRVRIAGKTGTAQAAEFKFKVRDEQGKVILGPNGKPLMQALTLSTPDAPNLLAPWYRGTGTSNQELNHAWFIGFAPADDPQIAFAVVLEYGGSGGRAAAAVARPVLSACIEHGYLKVPPEEQAALDADEPVELLRDVRR
jgi:cell division protein FtsI/penicillin-binding protein 2